MTLLLIVVLAATAFVLLRYFRPGDGHRVVGRPLGEEARWEERILLMTRGNRGALERAVTARRRRHPEKSRLELLKLVHDEYVKDRE
ncbi:hypothetical protein [uncultured Deinococcus sp.]|uniref:hypothetical protein n=1 Tax=uncultured Deinococcus sp. TaxID=158789 RepID=UPI0025CCB35E|nr:hypothetical protein [uncultured Deinococcus sp.]